jgi:hypothetical protein
LDGVKAVTKISDRMIRGAQPDGAAGMESLKKLGVKTILSVEEPDLNETERATAAIVRRFTEGSNGIRVVVRSPGGKSPMTRGLKQGPCRRDGDTGCLRTAGVSGHSRRGGAERRSRAGTSGFSRGTAC